MTAFLWAVVIAMAIALLAELVALVGLLLVAKRAARRISDLKRQVSENVSVQVRIATELKAFVQPRLQTIAVDSREIKSLFQTRLQTTQVVLADTSRRVQRIHLRLTDGVQTVSEQGQVIYEGVVEPIQVAGQIARSLKFALWLFGKVA